MLSIAGKKKNMTNSTNMIINNEFLRPMFVYQVKNNEITKKVKKIKIVEYKDKDREHLRYLSIPSIKDSLIEKSAGNMVFVKLQSPVFDKNYNVKSELIEWQFLFKKEFDRVLTKKETESFRKFFAESLGVKCFEGGYFGANNKEGKTSVLMTLIRAKKRGLSWEKFKIMSEKLENKIKKLENIV